MSELSLFMCLIFSCLLFFIGILGVVSSKNFIKIMLSLVISINAACVNFVFISKYVIVSGGEKNYFPLFVFFVLVLFLILLSFIVFNLAKTKNTYETDKIEKNIRAKL